MYRFTATPGYLDLARNLATYFLNNLPQDGIVPWDFNAPLYPAPRPADSSAAVIAASGLLQLAQGETNSSTKRYWIDNALLLLSNTTKLAWQPQWQSLLSNGTDNKPANSYSTGIIYGDYYFIKAGNDLISMNLVACPTNLTTNEGTHQSSALGLRVPLQSLIRTGCSVTTFIFFLGLGFLIRDISLMNLDSSLGAHLSYSEKDDHPMSLEQPTTTGRLEHIVERNLDV